jgi:hypothetical protein
MQTAKNISEVPPKLSIETTLEILAGSTEFLDIPIRRGDKSGNYRQT